MKIINKVKIVNELYWETLEKEVNYFLSSPEFKDCSVKSINTIAGGRVTITIHYTKIVWK